MNTTLKLQTKDITRISLFSAVIVVCSWISIPFTIPFTMQTFAIFLALLALGGKKGTISILVYIFLGILGLPVFAGFSGGVSALFGMTGGFIFGFVLQGVIYIILEKYTYKNNTFKVFSLIFGLFVCYLSGVLWFTNIYSNLNSANDYIYAISVFILPYIIPDLLKLSLALVITKSLNKAI